MGNASVYINTLPCYLPSVVQSLASDSVLTSLQLVGIAPMNATNGLTNIYTFGWQKGIDQTFGSLNNDPIVPQINNNPLFTQDYRNSVSPTDDRFYLNSLPFNPLTTNAYDIMNHPIFDSIYTTGTNNTFGLPNTNRTTALNPIFNNIAIPGRPIFPLNNNTIRLIQTNIPCEVGAYNDWSTCALSCSINGTTTVNTGYQIRFQPIVTLPTGNGTLCPTVAERSQTRTCTVTNPSDQLICGNCNNLQKDGNESDVDCGGNIPDIFPYFPITFKDLIINLFQSSSGTPPLLLPSNTGTTVYCPRCDYGRTCTVHNDCDRNTGLICLPGFKVCAPWWIANATYWIETNISMKGIDSRDIQGTAVSIVRAGIAGGANSADTNNPTVRTRDVALAGITYIPADSSITPPFRRLRTLYPIQNLADTTLMINLNENTNIIHGGRNLASSTNDQIYTRTIIGTETLDQANEIVRNLNTNRQSTGLVIEESLRSSAPLINNVELSTSRIVSAATVGTPGIALTTNIPNTIAPKAETGSTGLSGGAITGIVIGSIVGLIGLVIMGSIGVKLYQRYRERKEEHQRMELEAANRRRQQGGINIGEAGADTGGNLSPLMKTNNFINELKDKEKFKPTHALHQTQPINSQPFVTTNPAITAIAAKAKKEVIMEGNEGVPLSSPPILSASGTVIPPPSVTVVTTNSNGEVVVPSSPDVVVQPSPNTYASVQIVSNALKKAYSSLSSVTNNDNASTNSSNSSSSTNNNPTNHTNPPTNDDGDNQVSSPSSLLPSSSIVPPTDDQSISGSGNLSTSPSLSTTGSIMNNNTLNNPNEDNEPPSSPDTFIPTNEGTNENILPTVQTDGETDTPKSTNEA